MAPTATPRSTACTRSWAARAGATADVMAAQAKNLTNQQIADLAAYYASVPSKLSDLQNVN